MALTMDLVTWHHRLAHINIRDVQELANYSPQVVTGLKLVSSARKDNHSCEACLVGKGRVSNASHRKFYPADTPMKTVFSDIKGKLPPAFNLHCWATIFVDSHSSWISGFTSATKKCVPKELKILIRKMQVESQCKLGTLFTDDDKTYKGTATQAFLARRGKVPPRTFILEIPSPSALFAHCLK